MGRVIEDYLVDFLQVLRQAALRQLDLQQERTEKRGPNKYRMILAPEIRHAVSNSNEGRYIFLHLTALLFVDPTGRFDDEIGRHTLGRSDLTHGGDENRKAAVQEHGRHEGNQSRQHLEHLLCLFRGPLGIPVTPITIIAYGGHTAFVLGHVSRHILRRGASNDKTYSPL